MFNSMFISIKLLLLIVYIILTLLFIFRKQFFIASMITVLLMVIYTCVVSDQNIYSKNELEDMKSQLVNYSTENREFSSGNFNNEQINLDFLIRYKANAINLANIANTKELNIFENINVLQAMEEKSINKMCYIRGIVMTAAPSEDEYSHILTVLAGGHRVLTKVYVPNICYNIMKQKVNINDRVSIYGVTAGICNIGEDKQELYVIGICYKE